MFKIMLESVSDKDHFSFQINDEESSDSRINPWDLFTIQRRF